MDYNQVHQWEQSLDAADSSPITANLPVDAHVGDEFVDEHASDGVVRRWLRVAIVGGSVGARWAYWAAWQEEDKDTGKMRAGQGSHPEFKVVVDRIFNGDASHFVGMLGVTYAGKVTGVESTAWVLTSPKQAGPVTVYARDGERRGEVRYEKSKEVHDVETGETTLLP